MTKSTITRERLQELAEGQSGFNLRTATHEESQELARMALAAMDSSESVELPLDYLQGHKDGLEWAAQLAEANHPETGDWLYDDPIELAKAIRKGPDMSPSQPALDTEPVAYTDERNLGYIDRGRETAYLWGKQNSETGYVPLYRHAQPAPERDQVRREHAEWSQATFGDVGPIGPLKHLSKEALEAAEEPGDLSEWADMQFLMWDAQRRAGITDEQITQAMIEKLAVNKQRSWPEPKEGEPRLHIKEQPAPVVPEIDRQAIADKVYGKCCRIPGATFYNAAEFAIDEVEAWQAAMLAAAPQLPDNDHATVPVKWIPVSERMPVEFEAVIAFDGDQVYGEAVYRSGDGFTIDGYDPCDRVQLQSVTHWMPLPAAPQEVR